MDHDRPQTPAQTIGPRVSNRDVVSRPDRVIQVERVSVSREQQKSVSTALRIGRQSANWE